MYKHFLFTFFFQIQSQGSGLFTSPLQSFLEIPYTSTLKLHLSPPQILPLPLPKLNNSENRCSSSSCCVLTLMVSGIPAWHR